LIEIEATFNYVLRIDTHIETKTSKKPRRLEPQFDINDKMDIDRFYPLNRGQRFGSALTST